MTDEQIWVHFAAAALGTTMGLPMSPADVTKIRDAQVQSKETFLAAIKQQQADRVAGVAEWADAMLSQFKQRFSK